MSVHAAVAHLAALISASELSTKQQLGSQVETGSISRSQAARTRPKILEKFWVVSERNTAHAKGRPAA
jgi:hypothetical protein